VSFDRQPKNDDKGSQAGEFDRNVFRILKEVAGYLSPFHLEVDDRQ
jgi:hypothetical protein